MGAKYDHDHNYNNKVLKGLIKQNKITLKQLSMAHKYMRGNKILENYLL